ncbi:hypothetical protein CAL7716_037290 [Calothrix sp. PCC 7716]|nr:hypothetical protein CAL7716_037290 [Calothrix sp. PCC 7716]
MNQEMPSEYWQGVEQFNTLAFYACHDTLEALWIEALEPEKTFYQGILQVAVALYHLGNGNLRGATILLGEGTNRLRRYPSVFGGVDVDEFLDQSVALLKILQHTQPEMITNLILGKDERFPIPKIVLSAEC